MFPYLNQSHMRALGPPFLAHYNHDSPKGRIHLQSSTGWDPGGRWPPEHNQDSPGAQATSGFVLSLSFPDILADDARSPHSCAWIQGNPLKDFCDLRGLHHSFLEEGFCLCEGQKCLWRSAQTLVPRGSLGGEAILLVCWERLQAIHQGPR